LCIDTTFHALAFACKVYKLSQASNVVKNKQMAGNERGWNRVPIAKQTFFNFQAKKIMQGTA